MSRHASIGHALGNAELRRDTWNQSAGLRTFSSGEKDGIAYGLRPPYLVVAADRDRGRNSRSPHYFFGTVHAMSCFLRGYAHRQIGLHDLGAQVDHQGNRRDLLECLRIAVDRL